MEQTLSMLRSLRAVRRFRCEAVPESLVTELVEVARWTGSARNRQPWRLALVTDARRRSSLAALGAYAAFLADAPLVVLLAIDRRRGGADGEFDAGRFAQTLMLAAHARGLGSCPVSFFPDANVTAASAIGAFIEPWRTRTAIALGYPDPAPWPPAGRPATRSAIPTGRLPADELIVAPTERSSNR